MQLIKMRVREGVLRLKCFVLPSGMTASIAVRRAEGGWLCVGRKINTLVQVKCPTRAHISPFTAWVSAQNVLSKLGSH